MNWDDLQLYGVGAVAIALFIALFVGVIIHLIDRARRAVTEFAARQDYELIKEDDGRLAKRLSTEIALPHVGRLIRIIQVPNPAGDTFFFTRLPGNDWIKAGSPKIPRTSLPRSFIVSFQDVVTTGRTFVTPKLPVSGVGLSANEFVLRKVFDAGDLKLLDLKSEAPRFFERFSVFSEDPIGARKLLLCDQVKTRLLQIPPNQQEPLIAIAPGGIAMDMEPTLKSRYSIERVVGFSLGLSEAIADRAAELAEAAEAASKISKNGGTKKAD